MKRLNIRLKSKFMLVFCSLMLLSVATVLTTSVYVFHRYEKELYRDTSLVLNMSVDSIEQKLSAVDTASSYVVMGNAVQDILQNEELDFSTREPVYSFGQAYQALNDLLLNYYGQLSCVRSAAVCVNGKSFGIGDAYAMENTLVEELAMEVPGVGSKPVLYESEGRLFYVRNIVNMREMNMRPLGLLVLQIDLQSIVSDSLKSRKNLNYQPDIAIFSKNGDVLFTSFTGEEEKIQFQPTENGYQICRLEGRDYFVSYATHSAFDLSYTMYLPFDSVTRSMRLLNALTFAVAVLAILVNTLFCSRFVSQIIQQFNMLVTKMHLFQAGRYEELDRYRSNNRKDEVGYLDRSFDKMVGEVKRLVKENYLTKIAKQEAQLKSLQNQIDPHFLFNILQTINWKAKTGKQEEISHITESLGKILRYTLYKKEAWVPLREELEIVEGYVSIQKYRYGEWLSVLTEVPKKWGEAMIPPMALQNLTENSIKHALENMLEPCVVKIGALDSGEDLLLFVEDNGPGISEETLKKLRDPVESDEEIGLINIKKRLSLLLGERYTLSVYNTGRGTRAEILLPKPENEKERRERK